MEKKKWKGLVTCMYTFGVLGTEVDTKCSNLVTYVRNVKFGSPDPFNFLVEGLAHETIHFRKSGIIISSVLSLLFSESGNEGAYVSKMLVMNSEE